MTPAPDSALNDTAITLPAGRRLGCAEYGDPGGRPVLYFHGFPGSRLEGRAFDQAARALGVRVIAFDRPGMGLSDFVTGRRLTQWPHDVLAAADILNVDRFAVVGVSGGGPYAAACAFAIPERLTGVGIVSGLAPLGAQTGFEALTEPQRKARDQLRLLRRLPVLTRLVAARTARQAQQPSGLQATMADVDQTLIASTPEIRDGLRANVQQAFRQGTKGFAWDLRVAFSQDWGFPLADIRTPVHVWHGELDSNVFAANGHHLATVIPHCPATFCPDEGHLLFHTRAHEILTAVAA